LVWLGGLNSGTRIADDQKIGDHVAGTFVEDCPGAVFGRNKQPPLKVLLSDPEKRTVLLSRVCVITAPGPEIGPET
jgi:hypothetical protein